MATETLTLTDFLLARIAEDEAVANRAVRWSEGCRDWADDGEPDWEHIARHDPARVLAECDAKRRIVAEHPQEVRTPIVDIYDDWCGTCQDEEFPCATLRTLALPYADHPDYRDEWRANP